MKSAGRRACGPIEDVGRMFLNQLREDIFIHLDIIRGLLRRADPGSLLDKHFHLIISTPQSKARMMTDPPDVLCHLFDNVLLKFLIQVINRTGEHEVLPDDQPQLIAQVKEPIVRIVASAPDPDCVEVRPDAGGKKFL